MIGRVTSSVALKNMRNELPSDQVTVLATVYCVLRPHDGAYCAKKDVSSIAQWLRFCLRLDSKVQSSSSVLRLS